MAEINAADLARVYPAALSEEQAIRDAQRQAGIQQFVKRRSAQERIRATYQATSGHQGPNENAESLQLLRAFGQQPELAKTSSVSASSLSCLHYQKK